MALRPGSASLMKIASRPTTIARTPRPSANAARMIAMPRIWPAASGFRPIAVAESPAEDADADAGADDPECGETGADVLHSRLPPTSRAGCPGSFGPWLAAPSGASVGRAGRRRLRPSIASSASSAMWPSSSWWLSMARMMNMSVRTLKIRAWIALSMQLQADEADRDEGDGQRR